MNRFMVRLLGSVALVVLAATMVAAHITPPVVLTSDRDAVAGLLSGSRRYFVREVRLTPEERQAIQKQTGWTPDEDFYRFYVGRDDQGRLVAATIFMTEYTIHGPVRVAVALGPDGKVKGARVVELTEETYPWVKPLIDRDFIGEFVGQGSAGRYTLAGQAGAAGDSMTQFYGQVIASLLQRAAILYDTTVLKRSGSG
jgi:Na+-translocating ferredoxin:NAD+ oxidoreductase RnfG subunit